MIQETFSGAGRRLDIVVDASKSRSQDEMGGGGGGGGGEGRRIRTINKFECGRYEGDKISSLFCEVYN